MRYGDSSAMRGGRGGSQGTVSRGCAVVGGARYGTNIAPYSVAQYRDLVGFSGLLRGIVRAARITGCGARDAGVSGFVPWACYVVRGVAGGNG